MPPENTAKTIAIQMDLFYIQPILLVPINPIIQ